MGLFFLWSVRANGWYTNGGSYTSNFRLADEVSKAEALKITKLHYNKGTDEFGMVPVSADIMREVDQ